jgi:hypothetical protein
MEAQRLLRPCNHGSFEAERRLYPQGKSRNRNSCHENAFFIAFPCRWLLTPFEERAYIRAIEGDCCAISSCSFSSSQMRIRPFGAESCVVYWMRKHPWLFDIIGRKRSADGGFFAVSIGFMPDGSERDDAVTRFGSSLGRISRDGCMV